LKAYHFLGAAACGLLTAAAFLSLEAMFIAWISLIPLFFLLYGKKPGQAFLLSGTAGLFYHGFLLFQIPDSLPSAVLSILAWAFFGLVFSFMQNRKPFLAYLSVPFLWVGLEFVLTVPLHGYAWGGLGLSQTRNLLFIQMAGITGAYGVSFIMILFQAFFVGALKTGIRVLFIAGMVILVLAHLGGFLGLKSPVRNEASFTAASFQKEGPSPVAAAPDLPRFEGSAFGSPVGMEIANPDIARRYVRHGASFLATTGASHAGIVRTAASKLLAQAVLRAVENRRYVIQMSASSGVKIIDPYGRIKEISENGAETSVSPETHLTFFSRHGDVFALLCLTISAGSLILSFFKKRP